MNVKKRITKILAMMLCLIFCTNQVAVYGAELVSFSDGVEEQEELSSAGIEETDSLEVEEKAPDTGPGDTEEPEVTEEDFSDTEEVQETETVQDTGEEDDPENSAQTAEDGLFLSEEQPEALSAANAIRTYPGEISQDIYWQDNNEGAQAGRLSTEEYAEWFWQYGRAEVVYQDADGTEQRQTVKISDLLVDGQSGIVMEDLEGTGHYVMRFEKDSLKGNISVTGKDGKQTEAVIQTINLLPPDSETDTSYPQEDSLHQNYQFLNVPDENVREQYTSNKNIGLGWYYIKTMDFSAHVEIRCGDMSCGSDLTESVKNELYFQYQKKNQDPVILSKSLKETEEKQKSRVITEHKENGKLVSMDVTVSRLPQYRIDGTEILYDIREADDSQDNRLNSYDPGEGDYFSIDYNNTELSNHGTDITAVYNGGTIILTRRGTARYQAEKEWKDEENRSGRPEVSFTLWRYSRRGNAGYRQASQVKNKNGETLKYVIPQNSTGDSHRITFAYTENPSEGSVCLTEQETLPKYDPEGYPYVYFAREHMEDSTKYEQVLGKIICTKAADGGVSFQTEDTLPDGVTREKTDKSIYNGGVVSNVLTGTVNTSYTKTWMALAYQGELKDVRVEFTLQAKHSRNSYGTADDNWYAVQENGSDLTESLTGFDEEMTSMSGSRSMPKYDELGHELEYRWVETGIYQGDDQTNLLRADPDSGNCTFVLNQKNKEVPYTSSVKNVQQEDGSFHSEIVNRIAGKASYKVVKKWQDEAGNPIEAPEKATITLTLLRQDRNKEFQEIGTLVLDGVKDSSETRITDGEGNTIRAAETESWQGEFLDLPLYDKDGRQYNYLVVEKDADKYRVIYGDVTFDEKTFSYSRTIINRMGSGDFPFINVRKEWIDDSDAEHRGKVTFTVYKRTGEKQFEKLQDVMVSVENGWQKQVKVPEGTDLESILVLETSVKHTGDNGSSQVPCELSTDTARNYTAEEMEEIWTQYHSSSSGKNPAVYYHSDEHWYRVTFQTEDIKGISYYTVTNQRLGRILLDVTKEWIDGDGSRRTELKEALQKQGIGLYVKLICDRKGVIKYDKGMINTGTGEYRPVDADGKTVDLYQKISLETTGKDQKFYFYDLPKYDADGSVVHYSVKEVYAKELSDGSYQEISSGELEKAGINTEYTSLVSSKYQVGDSHTRDQQHFSLRNRLRGTKKITFHKQWKDQYRFEKGDRPDIYLNLYRQIHQADGSVKLELFYKDYLWRQTEGKDSHYYWTVDFDNLPKYDDLGYEILYYAQEKMHVNARLFDYTEVEYLDAEENLVGNEPDGFYKGVEPDGRLARTDEQVWILGENGTFVNGLKEDVRIEGKKIWGNVPRGFDRAVLPKATFTVYQKLEKAGTEAAPCASITIEDWSKQYVNAAYRFLLEYTGENSNQIREEDGKQKLTAESLDGTDQKLPLYDEEGRRYSYTVRESTEGLPEDASGKNLVFLQPVIHNFMVENFYESEKGNLTVKKILEAEKTDEENYPSVTYVLTRYYTGRDEAGNDVLKRDVSFKKMLTLDFDEFSPLEKGSKFASAEGTFEDLDIYAPSGEKFQYRVEEKKISQAESYELAFAKPGNCDENENLIQGQTGDQPQAKGNTKEYQVELLYASDDKKEVPDATFKNVLSDERIVIEVTKIWDDNDNLFKFRPSVEDLNQSKAVSFEVVRYAKGQPGVRNAIGSKQDPLEVVDEQGEAAYQGTWEAVEGKEDTYLFRITGTGGELEKYAPNGMEWIYGVREKYANAGEDTEKDYLPGYRNNTGTYWCRSSSSTYSLKEGNETYHAQLKKTSVTNHIRWVTTRIEKRWRTLDVKHKEAENTEQAFPEEERPECITDKSDVKGSTGTDYLGYYLSVKFVLQGRVKACYDADGETVPFEKGEWMDLRQLFQGEDNLVQEAPLTEILADLAEHDKVAEVTDDGVSVVLAGYMKNTGSWDHTLEYLPKYAKGGKQNYNEEGCYYELEYRLCEENISFRQSEKSEVIFFVDLSGSSLSQKPLDGTVNEIITRGNGKFDPFLVMGFFRGITGTKYSYQGKNTDTLSVWANAFPVTRLKVTKKWKDTSNVYGTRVLDQDGNWTVSFAVQRRIAGSSDETSWQDVYSTDRTGKKTKVQITLTGKDNQDAADINKKDKELKNLPVYGIEKVGEKYQVVRYEYRARELNPDGSVITGENGKVLNYAYAGAFTGTPGVYDVEYQKTETNSGYRCLYETTVTNSFTPTVRYAEKKWDLSGIPEKFRENWNCPEITLELQYQKEDGTLRSFGKKAIVKLDGTADDKVTEDLSEKGLLPAYGEYDSWKAIWKGLPEYIPGSAATKVKTEGGEKLLTVYRVTESHGGYYQEEEKKADEKDRDGKTRETALCFKNSPTEIQVSKTVDLGQTEKFDLDERIFGFTLTNDAKIQGTYPAVVFTEPKKDGGTAETELREITVGEEFYLKNRQSIIVYGLPVCKGNNIQDKITYYIEETDSSGKKKEDGTDSGYEPEFRTEIEAENTNLSEPVNGKKGGIQFAQTKGTLPSLRFRNILEGTIEIIKTDSTGKKLQNVEFLLEYSSDDGKTYKLLDQNACSNQELVANKGTANTDQNGRITFRGLTLGYKYRLTEKKALAGTQGLSEPIVDIELPMLLKADSGKKIKPVTKVSGSYVYVKLKYEISNNTVTMPMTSGNGFFWPGILGLILTGTGGIFWMHRGGRSGKKKGEYAK